MKQIRYILSTLVLMLLFAVSMQAQTDPGRTNKTIVADVLAQLPAQDAATSDALVEELLRTGDEGVCQIVSLMAAPGEGDNTAMEYALSGIARYVMQSADREAKRAVFSKSLCKSLSVASCDEVKFFVLTQLVLVGKGEAVPAVVACMKNDRLQDVACRALVNIGTPEAKAALAAIDYKTVPAADDEPAADDVERIEANRVVDMANLIQNAGVAALPQVAKAMKDPERRYRQAVLNIVSEDLSGDLTTATLLKALKKAKPEAQVDIMDYFSVQGEQAAVPTITKLLKSKDEAVYGKAISSLAKIGGTEALTPLVEILSSTKGKDNADKAALVNEALPYMDADVASALLEAFDGLSADGQVVAAKLFGHRAYTAASSKMFGVLDSDNADLAAAAYNALPGVATESNVDALCTMLEAETDGTRIANIKDALLAATNLMDADKREALFLQKTGKAAAAVRPQYYNLLSRIGSTDAGLLDTFFGLLAKGNDSEKAAALENLNMRPDCENVVRRSLALARKDAAQAKALLPVILSRVAAADITPERKLIFLRDAFEVAASDEEKCSVLNAVSGCKTFQGLVFAGRYIDVPALQQAAAHTVMNIGLSDKSFNGPEAVALLNRVVEVLEGGDARYEKEAVKKHLAEMDADAPGFVSLFNGTDLTGWKGLVENPIARAKMKAKQLPAAQVKADEVMRQDWVVEDGCLTYVGNGYDNICTEGQYGDFEMLVDWRLDAAGAEPDAGIYLRGTPQVQIWDIARTNVGAQVGSGGLYNNQKNKSIPSHVADNPTGEWNTFRIVMHGDRVSVWLNGDNVVDNVIMENYWDRSQPIPYLDQIELQAHGSKVWYRDIYVKSFPTPEPYQVSAQEKKEGFRPLFDGVTMHGWIGNLQDYVAEDGCIVLYPSHGGGGNLYTEEEFSDFVLRFDVWLTPGANNGLGVRTPTEGDAAYVGMELQILDNEDPIYKDLQVYQYHGSVYGVIPAKRGFQKQPGEWNTEEVYFKGNKVRVKLNDTIILEGDIKEASKGFTETIDHRDHPGLSNPSGHLGFLGHGSHVKFRNIRIKELK